MDFLNSTIEPHGGNIIQRELKGKTRDQYLDKVNNLLAITVSNWNISDMELIANGGYSPLSGFIGKEDYQSILYKMHLTNGLPWTIPITLPVSKETAKRLKIGQEVALQGTNNIIYGIIQIEEIFEYDKKIEAEKVYQTLDCRHPGVKRLFEQGDIYIAGPIFLLNRPDHSAFQQYLLDPVETRELFYNLGWKTIVGFQTRNPIHRAHEHLQKTALELVDGLFLNPLVGETKKDDIPADIRMESYQVLINNYYPLDRVKLGIYPAAMRYAGPREAVHHAIVRKNYGCTHFIVGRDHAGVGNYYGPYDSQKIFNHFDPDKIGIKLLFFENSFYCKKCMNMASLRTCPHTDNERFILSGTKVREMLKNGEQLPPEVTRPEVGEILLKGMKRVN